MLSVAALNLNLKTKIFYKLRHFIKNFKFVGTHFFSPSSFVE